MSAYRSYGNTGSTGTQMIPVLQISRVTLPQVVLPPNVRPVQFPNLPHFPIPANLQYLQYPHLPPYPAPPVQQISGLTAQQTLEYVAQQTSSPATQLARSRVHQPHPPRFPPSVSRSSRRNRENVGNSLHSSEPTLAFVNAAGSFVLVSLRQMSENSTQGVNVIVFGTVNGEEDYEELGADDEPLSAEEFEILVIPAVSEPESNCTICLTSLSSTDQSELSEIRQTPCGHIYHTDCIKPWLTTQSSTCPMCRFDLAIK